MTPPPTSPPTDTPLPGPVRHLYVHIPFCRHLCPYCGFYKHLPGKLANRAFVDALLAELAERLRTVSLDLDTVFFGGGTPSLLSPAHLTRLFEGLRERVDLSAAREISLEANPATFDRKKARLLRDIGVTRVTHGVQSWRPAVLATLGRDLTPSRPPPFRTCATPARQSRRRSHLPSPAKRRRLAHRPGTTGSIRPRVRPTTSPREDTFLPPSRRRTRCRQDGTSATLKWRSTSSRRAVFATANLNYAQPSRKSLHNQALLVRADFLGSDPARPPAGERWRTVATPPNTLRRVTPARRPHRSQAPQPGRSRPRSPRDTAADRRGAPLAGWCRPRVESLIQQGWIEKTPENRLILTRAGKPLVDAILAELV
ncbi:MAG: radical SAM protein [Akkermansiaceae bacterium]|nr:radical SAM protein [Akkermansiaceae bacterium]